MDCSPPFFSLSLSLSLSLSFCLFLSLPPFLLLLPPLFPDVDPSSLCPCVTCLPLCSVFSVFLFLFLSLSAPLPLPLTVCLSFSSSHALLLYVSDTQRV